MVELKIMNDEEYNSYMEESTRIHIEELMEWEKMSYEQAKQRWKPWKNLRENMIVKNLRGKKNEHNNKTISDINRY